MKLLRRNVWTSFTLHQLGFHKLDQFFPPIFTLGYFQVHTVLDNTQILAENCEFAISSSSRQKKFRAALYWNRFLFLLYPKQSLLDTEEFRQLRLQCAQRDSQQPGIFESAHFFQVKCGKCARLPRTHSHVKHTNQQPDVVVCVDCCRVYTHTTRKAHFLQAMCVEKANRNSTWKSKWRYTVILAWTAMHIAYSKHP